MQLQTPLAFQPLWDAKTARFLGAYGGRGSGKSWDRAEHLIYRMSMEKIRAAGIREVQNSIKDSVHQLLVDTIQRKNLGKHFDVTDVAIRSRLTGSTCVFRGMRDQNAESIKSFESLDVVWWEEAQNASQRSLDLLRPTVRKPGSQIWFTWNPRFRLDPVDVLLRQNPAVAEVSCVIRVNHNHNPHFTAEMEMERQIDLQGDPDRYAHIWEGAYISDADMQFIAASVVAEARKRTPYAELSDPVILGVDVARFGDDSSYLVMRQGYNAKTLPHEKLRGADTMQVVGKISELVSRYPIDVIYVDEGGVGAGVVDRLRQLNHNVIGVNFGSKADQYVQGLPKVANKRAEMWAQLRENLNTRLAIPDDDNLELDLTGPTYRFDASNAILLEKKEDMKRRGVKSPDWADALALTYAYPAVAKEVDRREEAQIEEEYDPIWSS